jgi:hypothetical protein
MTKEEISLGIFSILTCLALGFYSGHTYASAFDNELYGFALERCDATALRTMEVARENRELLRNFIRYYDR